MQQASLHQQLDIEEYADKIVAEICEFIGIDLAQKEQLHKMLMVHLYIAEERGEERQRQSEYDAKAFATGD
jgi:hypothetical protein